MNTDQICASIGGNLPSLFQCSPAPSEGVRVRTPMLYPDGGVIDVFVLPRGSDYLLTDHGEALGWLRMQSPSPQRSKKQQLLVEDVCHTLGMELIRGQLVLHIGASADMGEAVVRVAQGVVRISDLWFTLRSRTIQNTAEEVDEWLREQHISFERAIRQVGRSGQSWIIDYRTKVANRISMVFLLSTGARGSTRRISEHVLAGCVDLSHLKTIDPTLALISLFDDTEDVWQAEDFALVEQVSEIARWSRPDEVERILTAR